LGYVRPCATDPSGELCLRDPFLVDDVLDCLRLAERCEVSPVAVLHQHHLEYGVSTLIVEDRWHLLELGLRRSQQPPVPDQGDPTGVRQGRLLVGAGMTSARACPMAASSR
jgi:hypothetical protein